MPRLANITRIQTLQSSDQCRLNLLEYLVKYPNELSAMFLECAYIIHLLGLLKTRNDHPALVQQVFKFYMLIETANQISSLPKTYALSDFCICSISETEGSFGQWIKFKHLSRFNIYHLARGLKACKLSSVQASVHAVWCRFTAVHAVWCRFTAYPQSGVFFSVHAGWCRFKACTLPGVVLQRARCLVSFYSVHAVWCRFNAYTQYF
ncbi:hypothetical protein J6590_039587 [Homalodisca vitripennis]|nr:hypothetical protein J6590_039587 [Homalodisca vitripennis]